MDLTGASRTNNIEKFFKHKVVEFNPKKVTKTFLEKYINNKNNCCFAAFTNDSKKYDIIRGHSYILDNYDILNNEVVLINPHDSLETKKLSYDVFNKLLNCLIICNLEEE